VEDERNGIEPPVIPSWQDAVAGCEVYLKAQARAGEISEAAVKRYAVSWDQITAALGIEVDDDGRIKPIPLADITKGTVFDFILARREEDRATSTILDDWVACDGVSVHLGHTLVATTEIYSGHLRKDGAMWHYSRDKGLFGSLPPDDVVPKRAVA
jgi:hypothetical protein